MGDLMTVAPAAIGAAAGGGGVLAIARFLLHRMIQQYDKKIEELERKIESTNAARALADKDFTAKVFEAEKQLAVILALFSDSKNIRVEFQGQLSHVQGVLEAKHVATLEQIDSIFCDLYVAHERIRLIASKNDSDIDKIQRPEKVRRR